MPARVVPLAPPEMDLDEIRASRPVRGSAQWRRMAQNATYLKGKGGQLSGMGPTKSVAVGGSTTYESYIWPRETGLDRLWVVTLSGSFQGTGSDPIFSDANAFGTITDSQSADAIDWTLSSGNPQTFFLVTGFASTITSTQSNLTIAVNSSSDTGITVQSVTQVELPRVVLNADEAPSGRSCKKPRPIYDADSKSVTGVAKYQREARDTARRNYLFGWSENVTGVATSATAYTGTSNILLEDPPVLARLLRRTDTTMEVEWNVYAKVSAGTGEVKVTADSGDTSTITVTSTSKAWQTPAKLSIDTEHMSQLLTAGGIRDASRDKLVFEGKVDFATNTLTVYALSVGEELTDLALLCNLCFDDADNSHHIVTMVL